MMLYPLAFATKPLAIEPSTSVERQPNPVTRADSNNESVNDIPEVFEDDG
jgi:hypothetical protein